MRNCFPVRFLAVFFLLLLHFFTASAQFPNDDTFRNATPKRPIIFGGEPNTAFLTAEARPAGSTRTYDNPGSGYLQLTSNSTNQTGYVYSNDVFLANYGLHIEFEYFTHSGDGADGICFFLFDATVPVADFKIGAFGGSLGYSKRADIRGVSKGYLGIGLDEYGNFSNNAEGKDGGIISDKFDNTLYPDRVTLRGNESSGYIYLTSAYTNTGPSPFKIAGGLRGALPGNSAYRKLIIDLKPKTLGVPADGMIINVSIQHGGTADIAHLITNYEYNIPIPTSGLKYGISSSTGGNKNFHEIRGLTMVVDPTVLSTPQAQDVSGNGCQGNNIVIPNLLKDATRPNAGGAPNPASVDLDPSTPIEEASLTVPNVGTFTYDQTSQGVTFVPVPGFVGSSTIPYTFKDVYGKLSYPGNIKVTTLTPTVTTPTDPGAICEASGFSTSVVVSGTNTSIKWESMPPGGAWAPLDDVAGVISGTTTTVLTVNSVSYEYDNGRQYRARVTSSILTECAAVSPAIAITVNPLPFASVSPLSQGVCINSADIPVVFSRKPGTTGTGSLTFVYTITTNGIVGPQQTRTAPSGTFTINQSAAVAGEYIYTIVSVSNALGCVNYEPAESVITVNPLATATPTAESGTVNPKVCIGAVMTPIVFKIKDARTASVTPTVIAAGITWSFNPGTMELTIKGTPTVVGNFSYTVTTTGGCGVARVTNNIEVLPDTKISLNTASAAPLCINTPLTTIEYAMTDETAASITAGTLPAGVRGDYDAQTHKFRITGTPTEAGVFSYTVTATGTCQPATITGTINVKPVTTLQLTSAVATTAQTICEKSAIQPIVYQFANSTITTANLPAGLTITSLNGVLNISGTPTATGTFNYTITATGDCTTERLTGVLIINPLPVGFNDVINSLNCTNHSFNYVLQDNVNNTVKGGNSVPASFAWTVVPNSNVTGLNNGTGNAINATLINNSAVDQPVIYNITPTSLRGTCPGAPFTLTVLVPACVDMTITKTADVSSVSKVGDEINYTITVKNTGTANQTNVKVSDPFFGGVLAGPVTGDNGNNILDSGESWVYKGTYVITQADLDHNGKPASAGQIVNTASVNTTEHPDLLTASSTVGLVVAPGIRLVKLGVLNTGGNTVTYSFKITNTGNVTLNKLTLTDVKLPAFAIDAAENLAPGSTKEIPGIVYTISQIEKDAGQVSNTAEATGTSPTTVVVRDQSGTTQASDDPTVITVPPVPGIRLVKLGVLSTDGNTVTYNFKITNTGNVTLNKLTLTDIKLPAFAIDAAENLAPGSTKEIPGIVYTISQIEKDAGQVSNTAEATGTSPTTVVVRDQSGTTQTSDDPTVITVPPVPGIRLVKTGVISTDQNTITYNFKITNTGNVTLNKLTLTDVKLPAFVIDAAENLAPGSTKEIPGIVYTISQIEKDAGQVSNTAEATGTSPTTVVVRDQSGTTQASDDPTVITVPPVPGIRLVKTGAISTDHNTITYNFKITNTGNVTLNKLTLSDIKLPAFVIDAAENLAPGSTKEIPGIVYTISQIEKDAGQVSNTAEATGTSPTTVVVRDLSGTTQTSDDPTVITVPPVPGIRLVKTGIISTDQNTITYTFKITNTGNVTLNKLTLTDVKLPAFAIDAAENLAPGSTKEIPGIVYTISQIEKDAGQVSNTAEATGTSPTTVVVRDQSGTTQASDDPTVITVPPVPGIRLVKTGVISTDHNTITYNFKITNTGNVTLNKLSLTDVKLPAFAIDAAENLAPGSTKEIPGIVYTISQIEKDAGQVSNTAEATGTSPTAVVVRDQSGTTQASDDPTVITVPPAPGIRLVKLGVLSTDANTVTYTFKITNTGNVTLNKLTLTDIKLPAFVIDAAENLAPGSTKEIPGIVYAISQIEKDAGQVSNTAEATGTSPTTVVVRDQSGTTQTSDDPTVITVPPVPGIRLVKTGVISTDHNTITYNFKITNTGNVTLNKLTLTDIKLPAFVIDAAENLAPGSTKEIPGIVYAISQIEKDAGQVSNTAEATGTSPTTVVVRDQSGTTQTSDDPTVITVPPVPGIRLVKTGVISTDQNTITYNFKITNIGNVTLNKLTLSDIKLPAFAIDAAENLAPGSTKEIPGILYTITQAEKDAGQVSNTAEATGTSPTTVVVRDQSGTTQQSDAPTVITVPQIPGIRLVKTGVISTDHNTITYNFKITNTGNVTLNQLTLTDIKLPAFVIDAAENLAPGSTKEIPGILYTITQAEKDAGQVSNTAEATGTSPTAVVVRDQSGTTQQSDAPTVITVPQIPGIRLVKTGIISTDHNTITYNFKITNTGNVTLNKLTLSDIKLPAFAIDAAENLAPGSTKEIPGIVYTISQIEKDAGQVSNTAEATGTSPTTVVVRDQSGTTQQSDAPTVITVPQIPGIRLVKTGVISTDHNTITYNFKITNIGNVTLNKLTLTDIKLPAFAIDAAENLAPGSTKEIPGIVYTISQIEKDAGQVSNTAEATGTSPTTVVVRDQSGTTQASDDPTVITVPPVPGIRLVKTGVISTDQNTITYNFKITNTGNVTLNKLTLSDIKLPAFVIDAAENLAPGSTKEIPGIVYTISQAEKDAGQVSNTAEATGTSPTTVVVRDQSGTTQASDNPTIITVPPVPGIRLVKTGVISTDHNTITYNFKITNTGNVTLNKLTLTDVKLPAFAIDAAENLAPGSTKEISGIVYTISQAEKDAGQVSNTAEATGTSPTTVVVRDQSGTTQASDDPTVITVPPVPGIRLVKTGAISTDHNTITYNFKITNTGNVTLNKLTLSDIKLPAFVIDAAENLAPGSTKEIPGIVYTISQIEKDAGQVSNTAEATGTSPTTVVVRDQSGTTQQSDAPTVITVPQIPGIRLVKTGVISTDHNTITYNFKITNTGNVTLNQLTLTDIKLPAFVIDAAENLAPGSTKEIPGILYTITQAEKDAGQVSNTAEATGTSPTTVVVRDQSGTTQQSDAPTVITVPQIPDIRLVKTGEISTDHNTITYNFKITNTGNVTLNKLTLTDIKLPAFAIDAAENLAPGSTKEIPGILYTITQAEKDAGQVSNTAEATGTSPTTVVVRDQSGTTQQSDAPTVITVPQIPGIRLVKTGIISTDQNTITYTFKITNTGNVTLNKLTLSDIKLPVFAINAAENLAPGSTKEIPGILYTITQAEKDAGQVSNTAEATGTSPAIVVVNDQSGTTQQSDAPTVIVVPQQPAISLVKTGIISTDQNTITYNFKITNTGNVTLSNLTLTDNKLTQPFIIRGSLAPGQSTTAAGIYNITQSDRDAGKVINRAQTTGLSPGNQTVTANSFTAQGTDAATETIIPEHPSISLVKTGIISTDNSIITYSFKITNTGDVTLSNLNLTDNKLTQPFTITGSLAPGQSTTTTGVYTVTAADRAAGKVVNSAIVKAISPGNTEVSDQSGTAQDNNIPTVTPVLENPEIKLAKKGLLSQDQNLITYNFKIKNTGDVPLRDLTLTDNKLNGAIVLSTTGPLAPQSVATATVLYTVTQLDRDAGKVINIAEATGISPANKRVSDISGTEFDNNIATETIIPQTAAMTLTKEVSTAVPSALNENVNYNIKVTNTGNVTLRNVIISDPNAIITSGSPIAVLVPNQSVIITAIHTLTQSDIDAGVVINQAVAKGTDPSGAQVSRLSDDPSTPAADDPTVTPIQNRGSIALIKTGSLEANGAVIIFSFQLVNTGTVTLKNITLDDPFLGGLLRLNNTTLAPGQSIRLSHSYTVTQADRDLGKVTNTATATGITPAGLPVTDISGTELTNDVPVIIIVKNEPAISLVKTGIVSTDMKTIVYSFKITNIGNVTLKNIDLQDNKITSGITLSKYTLEPGEVVIGTATYTITDAEKLDGRVSNTATVTGVAPNGDIVKDISGTQANNDDPTTHIIQDEPQAINDNAQTKINEPITFSVVRNDIQSLNGLDPSSVNIIRPPLNGRVQPNRDGTVTYTPNNGYSGPDDFSYKVSDRIGKPSNQALVTINVIPTELFIPNTITPNGDGKNDVFKIIGRENFDSINLLIFNRWGNEVYRNKNYMDEWDGSGLNEGTYYYLIILKKGGNEITKKGWILIKR